MFFKRPPIGISDVSQTHIFVLSRYFFVQHGICHKSIKNGLKRKKTTFKGAFQTFCLFKSITISLMTFIFTVEDSDLS